MKILYEILDQLYEDRKINLKSLAKDVKEISDQYNGLKPLQKEYIKTEKLKWAYLFYFYPINVFKYLNILKNHLSQIENKRCFLDFGAGPLTFFTALAILDIKPEKLFAIDIDHEIMRLGLRVIKKINPELGERIKFKQPIEKIDVISFGNVFTEMADEDIESTIKIFLNAYAGAAENILILEPGTHKVYYKLRTMENFLKENGYNKVNNCPVDICPMSGKDWCHENLYFPRSSLIENIENISGLNNKFVNYCYLLMSKSIGKPFVYPEDTFRMISNLIEHKGYYLAHFCGKNGIVKIELQKRDVTENNNKFTLLNRGSVVKIKHYIDVGEKKRLTKESFVDLVWQNSL